MTFGNRTLFRLGILLIEVHYWGPFDRLEAGQKRTATIKRIATELFDHAGFAYGNVVKRCLQGLESRDTSWQHEDFQKEVCEKIVAPLEKELKHFCGPGPE